MAGAGVEMEPARDGRKYESEYGFEIHDPDELYEVSRILVNEPDFLCGRVVIGVTDHEYVSNRPRLVYRPEGLFYEQTSDIHPYVWRQITQSSHRRTNLSRLIREHVNPEFRFTPRSWKREKLEEEIAIVDKDNHVVAEFEFPDFRYQFSDDDISREQFLAELREALVLQQIILSEAVKASPSVTRFSSGITVGNPYLYSKGIIDFFPDHKDYLKEELPAMDKFRRLTDEYLATRMPDIDEARRIIAEVLPQYEAERLKVRALGQERHGGVPKFGGRRRAHYAEYLRDMLEEVQGGSVEGSCGTLGIDLNVLGRLSGVDAKRLIERMRTFWAKLYHPEVKGGGNVSKMVEVNNAADFLLNSLKKK